MNWRNIDFREETEKLDKGLLLWLSGRVSRVALKLMAERKEGNKLDWKSINWGKKTKCWGDIINNYVDKNQKCFLKGISESET